DGGSPFSSRVEHVSTLVGVPGGGRSASCTPSCMQAGVQVVYHGLVRETYEGKFPPSLHFHERSATAVETLAPSPGAHDCGSAPSRFGRRMKRLENERLGPHCSTDIFGRPT